MGEFLVAYRKTRMAAYRRRFSATDRPHLGRLESVVSVATANAYSGPQVDDHERSLWSKRLTQRSLSVVVSFPEH
jgi:hypothetical protein